MVWGVGDDGSLEGVDSGGVEEPKAHGGRALGRGTWQLIATNMALGESRLFRGFVVFSCRIS